MDLSVHSLAIVRHSLSVWTQLRVVATEDGSLRGDCLHSVTGLRDAGLLRVEFTEANGEGEIRYD